VFKLQDWWLNLNQLKVNTKAEEEEHKMCYRSTFRIIYLCIRQMVEGTIIAKDGPVTLKSPKHFLKPKNLRLIKGVLSNLDISCSRVAATEGIYIMLKVTEAVVAQLQNN